MVGGDADPPDLKFNGIFCGKTILGLRKLLWVDYTDCRYIFKAEKSQYKENILILKNQQKL